MKLFKYEMKKLLFNKTRLILFALLFVLYGFLGFILVEEGEIRNTSNEPNAVAIFTEMTQKNVGVFNQETFNQCQEIVKAAYEEYGKGDGIENQMRINPSLRFATRYVSFGSTVDMYWNGPAEQNPANILGVYPIEEKLTGLELANKTDSYEYKYYKERLELELRVGEPMFAATGIWPAYFVMFDWIFIIFLLLMVLTFFISPLFTQEVRTEMDSIVLCSLKGRREIVTAKLLTAALTSAILAAGYIGASLIGMFVGSGDFSGFDIPVRCLDGFALVQLDITVGMLVIMSILWLILVTSVFGLALAFISAKTKNQSSAFGIGIVVLLAGMMSGNVPQSLYPILWPVIDFNFGTLALFNGIFGGTKVYNFFGSPISYGTAAFIVSLALAALVCLLTFISQKRRSVV